MKKRIKRKILQILLYAAANLMWTGIMVFGFLQNTIY